MYTIKALVVAFLAGVILAGGATYWAVKPALGMNPNGGLACAPTPASTPRANEYATPAPTTGGLNPNDLKTVTQPNLPQKPVSGHPTPMPSSSSRRD